MSEDALACKRQAVKLLARREHSRLELERKLGMRSFDAEVVAATLDELEHDNLLDTARFAESYVRSRAEKGFGPKRIRLELGERGVGGTEADAALEAAAIDWAERARGVREKRFGAPAPGEFTERARQSRFLDYRGFEAADIAAALEGEHAPH
jgi:regulatory protein